jgi:hypothetical protein
MNLGKLLGAGKSIIGGGKPAAYRTDKRFYLPQFVSPKNPFANPAATDAPAELPEPPPQGSVVLVKKTTPSWAKPQKMPVVAAQGATARATTWVSKLNPAAIFRAAPSSAFQGATPVQAELSLEKVKVVHNDLTDADVEIVPMKSRPARAPASDAPPMKKSWSDLGERIMKATAL